MSGGRSEEYERGATIDIRTTVHVLGRTARLSLDAGDEEGAWRGTAAQLDVVERATRPDPGERFARVREFADAWHGMAWLRGGAPEAGPRPAVPRCPLLHTPIPGGTMRTRVTVLLAVALLALTACTSGDESGGTDDKPSAEVQEPSATPSPADTAGVDTAGLEAAVGDYTAAYFANKPDTAFGMLSERCKKRITLAGMAALTERAIGDYGAQDVKRFEIDDISADAAHVSYGVGMPKFDQKQEPWIREAGVWRYDSC
ncbi:hypothetical protein ACWD26_31365 [Streptomyces sp. NPDC002787]